MNLEENYCGNHESSRQKRTGIVNIKIQMIPLLPPIIRVNVTFKTLGFELRILCPTAQSWALSRLLSVDSSIWAEQAQTLTSALLVNLWLKRVSGNALLEPTTLSQDVIHFLINKANNMHVLDNLLRVFYYEMPKTNTKTAQLIQNLQTK